MAEDVPFAYDGAGLDARGQWFAQRGVARTTALALFAEAMHDAAVLYENGDNTGARQRMAVAQERFSADATALGDADLPVEVELGRALLHLIEIGAPQGTLYGP